MIALLLSSACALAAGAPDTPAVELPDGPAATAWAGVGPATTPAAIGGTWLDEQARDAGGAGDPLTDRWLAWARWLKAEAADAGEHPDPQRRTGLALLALEQRRWGDAWRHLARLSAHPGFAAGLMPRLLPGAPADAEILAGGLLAPLADGVVLRPAPPPATERAGRRIQTRRATVHGLRIGAAWIDMALLVEPAGVEVTLTHVGGAATSLAVRLPQPAGRLIGIEYNDWFRQDTVGDPLAVELTPECDPVVLFGRFVPTDHILPASPAGRLPAGLDGGGLWIEVGPTCEALRPRARAAAKALGELLDIPAGLREPIAPPPASPWHGTLVHLADPQQAESVLTAIASAAEAHVLPDAPLEKR
ncbi:MAG: hypothetical protein CMJ84_03350 [Planctomycetes bacterium]|jgi:hypothetical protein|nr:hypothetical protein [Planctomycetota bacterium]MDP6409084.1 hypothetical protein [Planctomycetota bacterium]